MLRSSVFWGIAVAATIGIATACSDSASAPVTYTVVYRLSASAGIAFDSVHYEDPQGTLVKIAAPPTDWMVIDTANDGTYVRGASSISTFPVGRFDVS